MTANLLMLVPTRQRPGNADAVVNSWQATSGGCSELCFVVDEDDPDLDEYRSRLADTPGVWVHPVGSRGMVAALNAAAVHYASHYRFLGFMGDDHRPRSTGWDRRFCECLSTGVGVVYGNDLLQGEAMPTAVALTSDIVRTLGYFAPPSMIHLCVDLCWKLWGEALGRITYLPDVVIEHMHPAARKAPMDAGYEEANSPDRMRDDAAAYYAYKDGQFHDDVAKLKELL